MNEYRRFLKDDLAKMRNAYEEARKGYVYFQDKLDAERESWKANTKRGWAVAEDRRRAQEKHDETMFNLRKGLLSVIEKAQSDFASIKADACAVYDGFFSVSPEQIDNATLELLKSNILNGEEMSALADKYADNITMRRLVGKYMHEYAEKNNDAKLKVAAWGLKNTPSPHREALDTAAFWCEMGLREDRIKSDAIAKVYDAEFNKLVAEYENISVPSEAPSN